MKAIVYKKYGPPEVLKLQIDKRMQWNKLPMPIDMLTLEIKMEMS